MTIEVKRQWFSLVQASAHSGISVQTLRRAIHAGRLNSNQAGGTGKYLINRRHLEAFIMFGKSRLNEQEKAILAELNESPKNQI